MRGPRSVLSTFAWSAIAPTLLLLLAVGPQLWAATIRVPDDYPTIQEAIDAAQDGDTVQVAAGNYIENLVWNAKNIQLIGAGRTLTSITGRFAGSCLRITGGVPATATVAGFITTNGSAVNGGGIRCENSSPMIRDNVISVNRAQGDGGGIYCKGGSPTISGNNIGTNTAQTGTGGGI